jgi:hypothetical protein
MTMNQQQENDCLTREKLARMEAHVQSRLTGRDVRHLQVVVTDHGLVLRGHAPTYFAKILAVEALLEATSLPICANEIEVA